MKYFILLFSALILSIFYSCENESNNQTISYSEQIDDHSKTQLLFSTIEYDLYVAEKELAKLHTIDLIDNIEISQKIYCQDENNDIKLLLEDLHIYADQVSNEPNHWSLEKLRELKGQYISLQTRDSYDPYLYQLWRFEEEMYYTTKAAMDPKLDLYEWGEFQMMVDCMNEDWQLVNLHYPSIELFGKNELGYKIQTMAKIHLQKSIEELNEAVRSDDYINYDLCNYATILREKYINYIKTFIAQEEELLPFLATI